MIYFRCWHFVAKITCIKSGFYDVYALFYIVVHNVHTRSLIKCFLNIFSLVWTPMSTKLWGFSCFLIRNMFGSLVVCLTHLAPYVHFPCIGHGTQSPLAHTFAILVMHWSMSCFFILACHVYLILCSIVFFPRFELHFPIHLSPLMHHYHCSYIHLLPSFLFDHLSIYDKKGESILQRVYQRVFLFLYDSCSHSQGEKFYFSCIFVGGEIFHNGDAYTKGEKTLC